MGSGGLNFAVYDIALDSSALRWWYGQEINPRAKLGTDTSKFFINAGGQSLSMSTSTGDVTISSHLLLGSAKALKIYNGATQTGEIYSSDTTWLRINQNVAKDIYTPRSICIGTGLTVGGSAVASAGWVMATGGYSRYVGTTAHLGSIYVPLTLPASSTTYNGSSVTAGTKNITVSTLFTGLPAGYAGAIKAWNVRLVGKSPSAGDSYYMLCKDYSNNHYSVAVRGTTTLTSEAVGIVHCNTNGDFQLVVGGGTWTGVYLQLLGYFI